MWSIHALRSETETYCGLFSATMTWHCQLVLWDPSCWADTIEEGELEYKLDKQLF